MGGWGLTTRTWAGSWGCGGSAGWNQVYQALNRSSGVSCRGYLGESHRNILRAIQQPGKSGLQLMIPDGGQRARWPPSTEEHKASYADALARSQRPVRTTS